MTAGDDVVHLDEVLDTGIYIRIAQNVARVLNPPPWEHRDSDRGFDMLLWKSLALVWALLAAGLSNAQSDNGTTEWPLHNDGLTTLVEW